jgi:hypothetical protein
MTELMGDVMLSLDQYADAVGASTRTVMRWLKAGEVPGAMKNDQGAWEIPASARKTPGIGGGGRQEVPEYGATVSVHPSRLPQQTAGSALTLLPELPEPEPEEPMLLEELDDMPAFLTVAQASRFLGIPQAQIVSNAERFKAEPIGTQGSLRVPQKVVRRLAGL